MGLHFLYQTLESGTRTIEGKDPLLFSFAIYISSTDGLTIAYHKLGNVLVALKMVQTDCFRKSRLKYIYK